MNQRLEHARRASAQHRLEALPTGARALVGGGGGSRIRLGGYATLGVDMWLRMVGVRVITLKISSPPLSVTYVLPMEELWADRLSLNR